MKFEFLLVERKSLNAVIEMCVNSRKTKMYSVFLKFLVCLNVACSEEYIDSVFLALETRRDQRCFMVVKKN